MKSCPMAAIGDCPYAQIFYDPDTGCIDDIVCGLEHPEKDCDDYAALVDEENR